MWVEVSALLVDQFHPPDYATHNIAALHLQKRHDDEHVQKYWWDKLYICNSVDPNMPVSQTPLFAARSSGMPPISYDCDVCHATYQTPGPAGTHGGHQSHPSREGPEEGPPPPAIYQTPVTER